jgi:Spy/CpxP family protein refolding chaperone
MLLHRKTIVASAAAAAGLVVAAAAYAQSVPKAAPPGAPAVRGETQASTLTGPPPAGQTAGLNLTQAQRDQVRALRETQRKDMQALREKLRGARQQLREAMRADIPDEAAVRAAAGAVAALRADQAALQARARAQFMKTLTPEQQARIKQARTRAAERARRAMRAERQTMMRGNLMMRRGQMMRRQYLRWWRDWI